MKYQKKIIFFTRLCFQCQKCTGADLKSVVNNSKYMFQQTLMKKWGRWETFTRNGGDPGIGEGGWFSKARDGKFESLYIVGRGVLTPIFYEDLLTSNSHLHCSFCCHVSLAEWVIRTHLVCYFT